MNSPTGRQADDIRGDHRQSLLRQPRESLAVELKAWFDPRPPSGIAKLIRAIFALRNQNGGFLVIGVDDKTLVPLSPPNDLGNVRQWFHPDSLQQTVSRYASHLFEVTVDFEAVDDVEYPVISVPTGVVVPVACRADLLTDEGEFLLREGDIYVRTLGANGMVSSAKMSWRDLPDVFGRCFDNREGDHVRFIKKLLPGLAQDLPALLGDFMRPAPARDDEIQLKLLNRGAARFAEVAKERSVVVQQFGFWEVILRITPPPLDQAPNAKFLDALRSANPDLTGWPVWLDSSAFHDESGHPYVFNDAWEAFIYAPRLEGSFGRWGHLDFWILDPRGEFYLRRALQDDLGGNSATAGKTLEPFIAILRAAEALAVGQAFARSLGCSEDATALHFTFKWSGLKGRELANWSSPMRWMNTRGSAIQDSATSHLVLPLTATREAIVTGTHNAILALTRVFGGYEFKEPIIRDLVDKLLDRKL